MYEVIHEMSKKMVKLWTFFLQNEIKSIAKLYVFEVPKLIVIIICNAWIGELESHDYQLFDYWIIFVKNLTLRILK